MPFNPERALVRYQLMEIIVRVAIEKYVRNKILPLTEEAVKKMLEDHVSSIANEYTVTEWRE